jgi:hypothetical protein
LASFLAKPSGKRATTSKSPSAPIHQIAHRNGATGTIANDDVPDAIEYFLGGPNANNSGPVGITSLKRPVTVGRE